MKPNSTSIIITTYNRPDALGLVLQALNAQTVRNFTVFIADDGSTEETATLIAQWRSQVFYPLHHVWQPDAGFRAAMARNRAAAIAVQSDYFIFLDGDCVPFKDFVARHLQLAETGWFVVGNRILLRQPFTESALQQQIPLWSWKFSQWFSAYLKKDINRLFPLIRLPDNPLRKCCYQRWQGAKTCNLALWREDFLKLNGFDERFQGWGHEDAELVVRLLHAGIKRKEGRFAIPVLHLWHVEQDRSRELLNQQQLKYTLASSIIVAQRGINQYFAKTEKHATTPD